MRRVLVVAHLGRPQAVTARAELATRLAVHGIATVDEADVGDVAPHDVEAVVVLGGDGTILRAAELVRDADIPVVGVNLGHVGFLAESEVWEIAGVVEQLARREYVVEERMTLDVTVHCPGGQTRTAWAMNEASIEKGSVSRIIELAIGVDGNGLSTFGGDGVVLATPTGSTAYAFSAGGPVVWPDVEAMLLVPLSAHALFARPLVVGPSSVLEVELIGRSGPATMWCDGRRSLPLEPGSRVEVRRGTRPVRLARLHPGPFSWRLVRKFDLPVAGWRGSRMADGGNP